MARFKKRLHKIPTVSRFCILNALFLASMSCYTGTCTNSCAFNRSTHGRKGAPTSKRSKLNRLTAKSRNELHPMNYLLKSIVFIALTLLMACSDQTTDAGDQKQKPKAYVFTDYSDKTELFVEFSALTVGQSSSFAAHFSTLSDFQPIAEGSVTVILSSNDQPTERFTTDSAVVPGIFVPKAEPKYAGKRQLAVELTSKTLTVRHELGEVPVYPNLAAALAAAGDEKDHGGDIPFLKEQQWKVDFATEVIGQHESAKVCAGVRYHKSLCRT